MSIAFSFDVSSTYTNTIDQSVGPTTNSSRDLVDSNAAHYIYLDATNGDDSNSGFAPNLAKATIDAAYAARTGVRQVIHILDSSTYTRTTSDSATNNMLFSGTESAGIQAAIGAAPTITFSPMGSLRGIHLDDGGGGKFLSGVFITVPPTENVHYGLVTYQADTSGAIYTITDCHIYDPVPAPHINTIVGVLQNVVFRNTPIRYVATTEVISSILISYTIAIGISNSTIWLAASDPNAGFVNLYNNIIYNNAPAFTKEELNEYSSIAYLGNTAIGHDELKVAFDQPSLIATISGTSTVTSLTPGAWIGYMLAVGGYAYYILNNNETQFFLENRFEGSAVTTADTTATVSGTMPECIVYLDNHRSGTADKQVDVRKNILIGKDQKSGFAIQAIDSSFGDNLTTLSANVVLNTYAGSAQLKYDVQITTEVNDLDLDQNVFYTSVETTTTNQSGDFVTPDAGIIITSNTNFQNNTVPLYFNQQSALISTTTIDPNTGYVQCAYDFRLRQRGKKYFTTDTQTQILSSPLLDIFQPFNQDVNPWIEETTGPVIAYASDIILERPATSLSIQYVPKNPIEIYDLHGNPRTDWDSWKKEFTVTFDSSTYTSNETIWKLYRLLEDKGIKRMYPRGAGNTMMPNSSEGTLTSTSTTTAEFDPDPLSVAFQPHHWKGFWITITDDYGSYDYYIDDNDTSTLFLIDKLGLGFPTNGEHAFSIEYILVQSRPQPLQFTQDYFTEFLLGGSWEEKSNFETKPFEYGTVTFTVIEAENPI